MSTTTSSEISSESETEPSFPLAFFTDFRGFAFLPCYRGRFRYVEVSGQNPRNVFQNILAREAILGKN